MKSNVFNCGAKKSAPPRFESAPPDNNTMIPEVLSLRKRKKHVFFMSPVSSSFRKKIMQFFKFLVLQAKMRIDTKHSFTQSC